MTVGELKKELEQFHDDKEISIVIGDQDQDYINIHKFELIGLDPDRPSMDIFISTDNISWESGDLSKDRFINLFNNLNK